MTPSSGTASLAFGDPFGLAVPFELGAWRGLRDEQIDVSVLEQAVAAHEDPSATSASRVVLKEDSRSRVTACAAGEPSIVVKEVRKAGTRRRLADLLRGSPARRGFRAGRALLAAGVGAARPLAALEQRHFGVPVRSLMLSPDLRDHPTAAALLAADPGHPTRVLDLLVELFIALHRNGFVHGDLRAQHVHAIANGSALRGHLIDLESVRFKLRLSDADRMEDLAQMNASIADDMAGPDDRGAAFARYAAEMPFSGGADRARERITRRSIARAHLFCGRDCAATTGEDSPLSTA